MIEILITDNSIVIEGHASAGEYGRELCVPLYPLSQVSTVNSISKSYQVYCLTEV